MIVKLATAKEFNVNLKQSGNTPTVYFGAEVTTLNAPGTINLIWYVLNATSVSIDNNIGSVYDCGFQNVTVDQTTTYNLTASNINGDTTKSLKIAVKPFAEVNDDGTTTQLDEGDTYTCDKRLEGGYYFDSGQSQVEIEVDSFRSGTYTRVNDSNNVGSLTYEIDSGSGYSSVNFNFTLNVGDKFRIIRSSTTYVGYVILEGTY